MAKLKVKTALNFLKSKLLLLKKTQQKQVFFTLINHFKNIPASKFVKLKDCQRFTATMAGFHFTVLFRAYPDL